MDESSATRKSAVGFTADQGAVRPAKLLPGVGESTLDVVIVNWNSGDMLAGCLKSLCHSTGAAAWLSKIVVVDNASTDNSLARAESVDAARLCVVRNDRNWGFGRACNQGSGLGTGEFILFLNPDVVLEPDSIEVALGAVLSGHKVALCGIRLMTPSGDVARTCARRPTAWGMCKYALGFGRIPGARARTYLMNDWDHAETRFVHHVIGAFYLVRRSVFEGVGGFDERFFMYLEDLDLSSRIADAGWKCLYVTGARAIHEGGGTSKRILGKRLFYSIRSRLQYAFKHLTLPGAIAVSIASLTIEPLLRLFTQVIRADFRGLRHTLEAYRFLIAWFISRGKRELN